MTVGSNQRVPELVAGADVRSLPLSALDGFVLSRIDGKSSIGDIVSLTGLPPDQVVTIVDKLVALGAVKYRGEASFDAPSGLGPRREGPGSGLHSSAPRRNKSSQSGIPHPRRIFSESGVSSPPPEMPAQSSRPRNGLESGPPTSRTHALPPSQRPAPKADTQSQAGTRNPAAPVSSPPPAPASQAPRASEPVHANPAMPPAARPSLAPSLVPEAPRYDPKELDEEVELPFERRKQVLELFYRLSEVDHYEALGIPYNADKKAIRSAYFALSKVFHPDTMFRKNLGSFKPKMVAIFQLLTEAYETLGKHKSREEYDAYLRSTKAARMAERALSFEPKVEPEKLVSPAPIVPQIMQPSVQSEEPSPEAAPPAREVSSEARRLAQEVIARRLRGVASTRMRGAAPPPSPASGEDAQKPLQPTAPPQPASRTDPQDLLRRLTRTLRDVGQVTGTSDSVTRAIRASQAALERGDLSEATQQAARAASLAPDRPELKVQHAKLSAQLSETLANTYIEQARFEMKHGKWASAALTWTKVCEGRPNDAPAHRQAAQALLKAGGDMRGAQRYAQKAVFLAPSDIEARLLLAQICLTVGLKLNARRELEASAKLDPANEMVKNLLADLDKG